METKKSPKFVGLKVALKSIWMAIFLLVLFYGSVSFITLDLEWPLSVSNVVRGLVVGLYIIVAYMSMPDRDDYKSVNQRR